MHPNPSCRRIAATPWICGSVLAASLLGLTPASAVPLHAGDIFPLVDAGVIRIANGATVSATSATTHSALATLVGQRFFSGDFGDIRGGALATDNPGFDWRSGVWPGDSGFPNSSLLGLQAVGQLGFWNGSTWVTGPAGSTLSMDDVLGRRVSWTGTGISTDPHGYIGQASGGSIHSHLNFSVNSGSPVGAWLVNFRLFSQEAPANLFNPPPPGPGNRSPGIADSAPLTLVFNRGLSAAGFAAAVDSLQIPSPPAPPTPQQVPLPAGALLLGFALFALSARHQLEPTRAREIC